MLTETIIAPRRRADVPLSVVDRAAAPAEVPAPDEGGGFDIERLGADVGSAVLLAGLVVVSALALRMVGGARFNQQVQGGARRRRPSPTSRGSTRSATRWRRSPTSCATPRATSASGAELPSGIILHGPPGTGKTLLARAVAGEAGVPFFSASGSEFVEVYSGLGSKRVRALFAAARKAAPAVVYIDEIDAVGGRRTGHASAGEREQTLDQLLSEMDGFAQRPRQAGGGAGLDEPARRPRPGPVRSGASTARSPWACRAGGAPGDPGRPPAGRPLAAGHGRRRHRRVHGRAWPGADLAALCNEASFEAARAGTAEISLPHFRGPCMRLVGGPERRGRLLSDDEQLLVAYHEMGHALVGHLSPRCDPVERVTVIPQGQALGVTIALPTEDRFLATRGECIERHGDDDGRPRRRGAGLRRVHEWRRRRPGAGRGPRPPHGRRVRDGGVHHVGQPRRPACREPTPRTPSERIEDAARELIEAAFATARRMLEENMDLLHTAAHDLVQAEALEKDDLFTPLRPPPDGAAPRPARGPPRRVGVGGSPAPRPSGGGRSPAVRCADLASTETPIDTGPRAGRASFGGRPPGRSRVVRRRPRDVRHRPRHAPGGDVAPSGGESWDPPRCRIGPWRAASTRPGGWGPVRRARSASGRGRGRGSSSRSRSASRCGCAPRTGTPAFLTRRAGRDLVVSLLSRLAGGGLHDPRPQPRARRPPPAVPRRPGDGAPAGVVRLARAAPRGGGAVRAR